ncbi:hypothetical protein COY25_01675 [Candidatus Uhrbacteria bacterium CG_4_10_14_0_2_um_filter_41_7]|uniref:Uncharacterized protein n=1 Tax=Candidatus Uhrbacteria bacterium CG_4_9_14_3_um_filter_41_35 TaxID=1975034 RepID=A0A2M7XG56_9BACT|nr:MAG: hypothetical protein COV92_02255 [Candidatus Uhrbacteria bacterium CG11_big_fil_rev_8_21_14_0_20_41_9]PIZ54858.1 MAG: hypothetical protein COY25_01675 [Candidatus Uhrbacteria bacterium CG_4_10_14_0_2_um_filter_41_7]PJA46858.1 MAG: hypothetical protein CO173_01390 [Candidatus Uhrbacteria bacterium CG_4_9_14_3_um_filter_41_35]
MTQENSLMNWVLGGALLLIGLFIISAIVLTKSQAEIASVQVSQVAPAINSVKLCAFNDPAGVDCLGIANFLGSPNAQTQADIWLNVTDLNGYGDVTRLTTSVHRSGIPLASCMNASVNGHKDGNFCYNNMSFGNDAGITACTVVSSVSATTAWWKCTITFEPWMDATDALSKYSAENWMIQSWAQDSVSNNNWKLATFENTSVLSMNFGSTTISYGQMSLGATKAGVAVLGTLYGNSDADMTIQANVNSMACDGPGSSSISVGNQKFSTDDVVYELLASSLTTFAQDLDFETSANGNKLLARTSETANPTDSVFFGIQIPNSGVSGTCSVTATILSVAQ